MKTLKKVLLALGAATIPLIPYLYLRKGLRALGLMGASFGIAFAVGLVSYELDTLTAAIVVIAVNVLWRAWLVRDVLKIAKQKEEVTA